MTSAPGATTAAGATIIGVAQGLAAAGIFAATAPAAVAVTAGGAVLGAIGFIVAGYRAIPAKSHTAADFNGQAVQIEQLDNFYPPILRLGILGPPEVGKTTLIRRVLTQPPPNGRTRGVHVYIAALQITPVQYVALIDCIGEELPYQFEVLSHADIICVLLDHNISHTALEIVPARLERGSYYQNQFRSDLRRLARPNKPIVYVIGNKRDLWQQLPHQQSQQFVNYLEHEVQLWRESSLASDVKLLLHSNQNADDVPVFVNSIISELPD